MFTYVPKLLNGFKSDRCQYFFKEMGHSVCFLLLLILSYDICCCNSEGTNDGFLMFSKVRKIESINVIDEEDPISPVYTITNNKYIRAVAALAFDYKGERLFFSDERKQNILSTFLNGTNIKVVVKDIGQVHGLAYERSGGDIYFTSSTESRISKINVNIALNDVTTKPEVLIQQPEEERPRAIVIEHCKKYMYWVTWSKYRPSIQRARPTGKDIQIVINTDILSPQGLTIDHTTNILYWSDATLDKIEKCDLDGSNRKIISSVRQQSFGLAVLGKYLYWTDWLMNAVIRINKFDGSDLTRIRDNLFVNPRGIIAIHRDSNTCIIDKCKEGNHECQDVCVIDTNGNVYCQCTYGILDTDGKTCKIVTQIIKPPEDQRIAKGSTAIFYCGVSQYAKVKVTWKWTYRKLQWNRDDQIFNDYRRSISVDGTLTIKGVKFFDIGEYTCTVTSIGGNDKRSASLTVIEFPLSPIISIATLYPFDERAAFVKWVQGFDGNSPITRFIIEYREVSNDNEHKGWVTFKSNIQPDIREAIITDLRPARNYQFRVTASNEVGNGSPSMPQPIPPLAIPQLPPSCSPKDFYGIASSETTIRLAWIPPDEDSWNGPLFGYFIKYKLAGSPDSTFQQKLVPVSNSYPYQQYELQGLAIYKTYDIQIAAFNGKGAGVYSIIKVATSEGLPTASPEDLRVRVLNSTAVNVSWTPPNQEYIHGKNLGYKVLALKLDKKPTQSEMIVPHDPSNPIGTQHAILHNLKPFTVYEISVLCYTGQGDGPQSNTKAVKTAEDLPSQIEWLGIGEVTEESVTINWKPPIERNGIIIGYILLYWRKKDNRTRERIYLPSSAHTNTLSNLSSMTIYTVSMFASTSVGNGPSQSIDVESWIPPGFPLPPSSLAVSLVDTRSAELLFILGSDGGNPLSSFHVEALEGNVSAEWKTIYTQTIDGLAAPVLKVENLKPFTDYKLRTTAENAAGQSFPSGSTRLFKTLQDVPENPPGDITVRALNATALRITWKPLPMSDWNGVPRGYVVYYKLRDTNENVQTIDIDYDIRKDNIIISGLREWTQYEITMIAYNDVGYSRKSTKIIAWTMESVPSRGPENVDAIALSSTSVNVSWDDVPILHQHGIILGFKVEYKSPLRNISSEYKDAPGRTTRHVIVENLQKFVLYEVRVLAYTRRGDGVLSTPETVVKTMADVPGPPSSVWFPALSYYEVTIEWQPPLDIRGIPTGYRLEYKISDSEDEYITNSYISSLDTNFTARDLYRGALYDFRLTAESHVGWGEAVSLQIFTDVIYRDVPPRQGRPYVQNPPTKARSVTIYWYPTIDRYTPIRNFTVQYKSLNNDIWNNVLEPILSPQETYEVKGLRPDTMYAFRIAASNDIGTSPFSEESMFVFTQEDYPEGAPRYVSVERLTSTSVKVSWEQPRPRTLNGKLLGYVLMYKELEDNDYAELIVSKDNHEENIYNLTKFVYYEFLVKAFNAIGSGPASEIVTVFVGEAAPSAAPVNIETTAVTSTEIHVTWLPPSQESQNGDLSEYRISYWRREDPESSANQVTTEDLTVDIVNLDIYTEYCIRIQAINRAGEGPKSDVIFETTLEDIPGKPVSLTFWNVTYTSLDMQWEPPLPPNGIIIKYKLTYQEQNSARESHVTNLEVPGDSYMKNIKNLRENATYVFSVSATNSIGQGQGIVKSLILGPQPGSPEAPHHLTFNMDEKRRRLILEWRSGSKGQLSITRHEIQAQEAYSCKWTTVKKICTDTWVGLNLRKLKPETKYRLRVIAFNTYGASPQSVPSDEFKTPAQSAPKFLLFSTSYFLEGIDMFAASDEDPVLFTIKNDTVMRRIVGLTFDYRKQRIFYSNIEPDSNTVMAVSFDGTKIFKIAEGLALIEDLSFERTNGDIYFTSYTNTCIGKVNVNDALRKKSYEPEIIVQLEKEDRPRGIVVDTCLKMMYWTNWREDNASIQCSDITGRDVQDIVTTDIKYPNGIVIDHLSKNLYWTDAGTDTIERCDMDGLNRVVILRLESSHPFSLAVYDTYLFWTDWQKRAVMRANKYDGSDITVIRHNVRYSPMGIIAVADDSENCRMNKCFGHNNGCQDICYTDINGEPFCKCSNGMLNNDAKTCSKYNL